MYRVGLGFDIHRLEPGRELWLGGVKIPSALGAVAHSDGDVLLHALTDAILGAVGGGDIGERFPDTDPRWKGHASARFVEDAASAARDRGFTLVNIDATVFLQEVKLSPYKQRISERLKEILGAFWPIEGDAVNVKAKTMESCDAVGEGRAVSAQVVVLLASTAR
ncbi:MAG: 2-C-methyl-D-erythritol 2,4-cyclodiphosphate synthase [Planctomycetes bacterium]|nr:2-C-methyl-D-erythritol 2,4-cyclodiphosphate synthase [Planctomycetota bacterium]